jgi:hypothetical protein
MSSVGGKIARMLILDVLSKEHNQVGAARPSGNRIEAEAKNQDSGPERPKEKRPQK